MIQIKNLTVKNFMSVGAATQGIDFDRNDLTLVLGENLDLGGDGSRNGTGKTTIINALSYALYGQALSNIRKDNQCFAFLCQQRSTSVHRRSSRR